ncbi:MULTISPECIES: hypothetical protein [Enterococcus]|uniref:hypothetical protein n=1 Tax=Enterococcus TaxID=1350 RepID=UPI000CF2D6CC|nr:MULTISPECIES: hypothetical protein [Enterococcus]EGP5529955.1 hypothetical protein [Enterococcus faecium]EKY8184511.1 hypothetical protein [Enterococcus faecium]EME3526062.1 hypothetical protein [Enterococcus faecium]EME7222934.1 hypothetical protein [Enterococcus faecium]EMF0293539.1 hypothetical protein [Enterococcus faecium]
MPKAKRKHSDTPTDFIAFDELLAKANKKIKTPPAPPHEFDFLSHEFDFPSHEFDFPSHEFDFPSKDDSLTLSENERQVINELAEILPDSILHQQAVEEPTPSTSAGSESAFVADKQKMDSSVEGNVANSAQQRLYEIFGNVSFQKGREKRIPQEVYDQIQQALTLPDLNQSQIALFFGVSKSTVNTMSQKKFEKEYDIIDKRCTHQLLRERIGEVSSKQGRFISQELRNQVQQALTIPDIKQRHIASFFGLSRSAISYIYQEMIGNEQSADIAKPVASKSSPTLSSNQTNER